MEGLKGLERVVGAYHAALEPFWHPVAPTDVLADGPIPVTLLPPLSSRMMLHVRPADLPLVAFQKWLEGLHIPQEV